jgi:serpin B
LRLVNFQADPEAARQTINQWVSEQTKERIKDLFPQGLINPDTRLALANAIYFKAKWENPFAAASTRPQPFTLLDGSQASIPMMAAHSPMRIPFAKGPGYQAVDLPYKGNAIRMLVLVPDAGTFKEFEAGLKAGKISEALGSLEEKTVALSLPKFTFSSEFRLAKTLSDLGMPDAFDPGRADFSGMTGKPDLFIRDVVHKAFVAVDEEGTEAAAATGVAMELSAALLPDETLTVDRPFIFLIRDSATGSILFSGRVLDPRSS